MTASLYVILGLAIAGALYLLWRFHVGDSSYDFADLLLDHTTGKASLDKHILAAMAVLAAWVVVIRTWQGKDVDTLLLGVLAVFVVQRGATKLIDTMGTKQGGTP